MKNNKNMPVWGKIVLIIIIIIFGFIGVSIGYTSYELGKINTVKISKSNKDLGIKPEVLKQVNGKEVKGEKISHGTDIINIAFFGVDRRYKNEPSRSDSIMILTIDELHKKIKMSSIMRDTYVDIKEHGKTKINHAYAYGGPLLAIRTINENFNLDIKNYVTVDFFNLESIIDALGGVSINVRADEINFVNSYMREVANLEKQPFRAVTSTGIQNLDGKQAVAYSRIRYTAGGDYVRTERQRTVLSALLVKVQVIGKLEFPYIVAKLLPYTQTSISSMDIIKLGSTVFASGIKTLDQERFPLDGYSKGQTIGKVWYLVPDINATRLQMQQYIYDDKIPVAK